jgi:hypothetical protein
VSVVLWERREPVEKGAIGSEAQARRIIESIEARAVELRGERLADALEAHFAGEGGEERRRQYQAARDYIKAEGPMKKSDDRAGFFADAAGAKLYAAAAGVAAHSPVPALQAIEENFLEALSPIVELLKRDGLTRAQAIDRAATVVPKWYALRRSALNGRGTNELHSAGPYLEEAREIVRRLAGQAQALVRKSSPITNEQALREAAREAPPWAW